MNERLSEEKFVEFLSELEEVCKKYGVRYGGMGVGTEEGCSSMIIMYFRAPKNQS